MTNAELIATIRKEIIKRIDKRHLSEQAKNELVSLLSFLNTLESEKPMEQDGLEEELDRFIASGKSVTVENCGTYKVSYHDFKKVASHFAEWGYLRAAEKYDEIEYKRQRADVCEDLEEEVKRYYSDEYAYITGNQPTLSIVTNIARHFAQWQKDKDTRDMCMSDNRHFQKVYELGRKDMREQMMKEAVEGEVVKDINNKLAVTAKNVNLDKFKFGDKVRVIVLPKED